MNITLALDGTGNYAGTSLALADKFIADGHRVKFILLRRDEDFITKMPDESILTVFDRTPNLLSCLNPLSLLRKWSWAVKRWGDTDLVVCFDSNITKLIRYALKFDHSNVPCVSAKDILQFQKLIEYSNDYAKHTHKVPDYPHLSKILVVEFGGIGDIAERFADIKALKNTNPQLKVHLLVKPPLKKYAAYPSYIDGVIAGDKKPLSVMLKTAEKIRTEKFDGMSDLGFAGGHSVILQALCKIPNKLPKMTWRPREDFILETSILREEIKTEIKALTPTKKVFVCIGSGGSDLKKWPNKYWKELLRRLTAEDWGVVFCGNGANEQADAKEICSVLPSGKYINFIDKTELEELAGIAKQCDMCIGNDTGLLHIAALSGVPSIGLFSQPTSWRVGLRMPWFKEIAATNEIKKFRWEDKTTEYVLDRISPDTVYNGFYELAEKFGL